MRQASAPIRPVRRLLAMTLALSVLAGCASTPAPVVYAKNPRVKANPAKVEKDVADCRALAEADVGLNNLRLAGQTGRAAAVGFTAGAVGSLVNGSSKILNRAAAGAAGGAAGVATKVLLDWNQPDEVHKNYVERCMKARGHIVLGWR